MGQMCQMDQIGRNLEGQGDKGCNSREDAGYSKEKGTNDYKETNKKPFSRNCQDLDTLERCIQSPVNVVETIIYIIFSCNLKCATA